MVLESPYYVPLSQKSCAHEYNYVVRLPTQPVTIHVHSLFGSHFARCIVKVHLFLGKIYNNSVCTRLSFLSPHNSLGKIAKVRSL